MISDTLFQLRQASSNIDSPSQPKRSFLKKGEGIARFDVKPGQKPPRPKKPTSKTSTAQSSVTQKPPSAGRQPHPEMFISQGS